VVQKFLTCGDLTKGLARVRCDTCRHEYLLAFSCRGRRFCPSCRQKRVLQFGDWVAEGVLAAVPHRQYVFTVPKMLRVYFRRDRRLLGKLSQCAADALKTLFRAAGKDPAAVPGIIIAVQTYGDLVNVHPHLHALVTDGVFTLSGWFVAPAKIDLYALGHIRSWLERPQVQIVQPGPRRLDLLDHVVTEAGAAAGLTTDVHLAALAIEHQAELHSNDADFSRTSGLRWTNPLR